MSDFIKSLSDASDGLSQVEDKGASLAKLSRAGLPVPPGFTSLRQPIADFWQSMGRKSRSRWLDAAPPVRAAVVTDVGAPFCMLQLSPVKWASRRWSAAAQLKFYPGYLCKEGSVGNSVGGTPEIPKDLSGRKKIDEP